MFSTRSFRRLKHASIPVAGADRLKLTEHIAIIDLMNLADALLLPQDDLALAVALKSPLFGLDEDDLFALAWDRKGSLREALSAAGRDKVLNFRMHGQRLEECERRFTHETPFAFYAWLLGGDGGRQRILRRLGSEANDALDEFLELALNYERKAPASLQGFMAWLRSADTEVKRDMEISRDEVRVMTVHGAKGLEASVVIMVDTTSSPSDTQRLRLINLPRGNGGEVTVWAGRKADDPSPVAAARLAMLGDTEDEYRRLLYVAMTRAADRLIVAGIKPGNSKTLRQFCWYDLADKGLAASGLQEEIIETDDGKIKRYTLAEDTAETGVAVANATSVQRSLPAWLRTPLPAQATASDLLRPSDAGDDEARRVKSSESVGQRTLALRRGTLAHRLLQSLPDVAADRQRDAALNFLRRNAGDWTDQRARGAGGKSTWADRRCQVCGCFRQRQPGRGADRRPADAAGRHAGAGFGADRPSGGDRKRSPDRRFQDQSDPAAHGSTRRQPPISASSHFIVRFSRRLYPQRTIRTALLWTETPEFMEISAAALDAELSSIANEEPSELDPARVRS